MLRTHGGHVPKPSLEFGKATWLPGHSKCDAIYIYICASKAADHSRGMQSDVTAAQHHRNSGTRKIGYSSQSLCTTTPAAAATTPPPPTTTTTTTTASTALLILLLLLLLRPTPSLYDLPLHNASYHYLLPPITGTSYYYCYYFSSGRSKVEPCSAA